VKALFKIKCLITKLIEKPFGKKVRKKPLINNLQVLNIIGIYELETAKLFDKISSNSLPFISSDHLISEFS